MMDLLTLIWLVGMVLFFAAAGMAAKTWTDKEE